MHILTGNGDVTLRECTSSLGMRMRLTGNGDAPHREWGWNSPGMHILNENAYSLYRMFTESEAERVILASLKGQFQIGNSCIRNDKELH